MADEDEDQGSGVGSQEPGNQEPPGGDEQTVQLQADLEAARARASELEAQLAAEQEARSAAESRGLDAHRRALIAAHAGEIVDELVQGASEEALDASVGVAKAAYDRIRDLVTTGQHVPPGATERGTGDLDNLSPLEKIARGLGR